MGSASNIILVFASPEKERAEAYSLLSPFVHHGRATQACASRRLLLAPPLQLRHRALSKHCRRCGCG